MLLHHVLKTKLKKPTASYLVKEKTWSNGLQRKSPCLKRDFPHASFCLTTKTSPPVTFCSSCLQQRRKLEARLTSSLFRCFPWFLLSNPLVLSVLSLFFSLFFSLLFFFSLPFFVVSSLCLSVCFSYLCLLSPSPLLSLFSLLPPRVETMFLSH